MGDPFTFRGDPFTFRGVARLRLSTVMLVPARLEITI